MRFVWRTAAVALLVAVYLMGCTVENSDPSPPKPAFTVGMPGAESPTRPYNVNAKAIVEAAGGRFLTEPYEHTPEGSVKVVKNLIAAGCDGIILFPMSDTSLPYIAELCEEAGVYWTITAREVRDVRIQQQVEASPYFVGMVAENEEAVGYGVTEVLGHQGATKMAVFSTTGLDTTGAARERGMRLAAEEYGIQVVNIIRNPMRGEDVSSVVESMLKAYPSLDAFLCLGTLFNSTSTVILNTVWDAGKAETVRFAAIDFEPDMDVFFDRGLISIAFGGHIPLDASLAAALLANTLMGTPLEENGPVTLRIDPFAIQRGEELRRYYEIVENGTGIFSPDSAKRKLFKWESPDITVQSIQELIDDYGIETVAEWRTGE